MPCGDSRSSAVENALPDDDPVLVPEEDWKETREVKNLHSKGFSAALGLSCGADEVNFVDDVLFEAAEEKEWMGLSEMREHSTSGDEVEASKSMRTIAENLGNEEDKNEAVTSALFEPNGPDQPGG